MEKVENPKGHFIDPVCGMRVNPHSTHLGKVYKGRSYWFCAESCREAFDDEPEKYLKPKSKKGWWARYLKRLNRASGGNVPSCH